MDDRHAGRGGFAAHGRARYRAVALLPMAALMLATAWPRAARAAPAELKAAGRSRSYEVKVAGSADVFRFTQIAGCRYRLIAEPGTLARPVLEVGRAGEEPLVRVDAGASGQAAVHVFDAERDAHMEVRVLGFSAQTGRGQLRLETLGPDDRPGRAHRRYLSAGGARARVGELLVGEENRWELVVEPGRAYEIRPTRGSAGLVRLQVHGSDGALLGDSAAGAVAWLAYPPVRFRVPASAAAQPEDATPAWVAPALTVRGVFDGGGTYGLRLRALPEGEAVEPPAVEPPPGVVRGPVPGQPGAFQAGPGDFAMVYVQTSADRTQVVEMLRGERWIRLEDMGLGGSARSQENALVCWFQPYYPGTYRFRGVPAPPATRPRLSLHDRAALGSAPVHMGTGADPTPRARLNSSWRLVALGVCMPGWDYLFVCAGAPDQGVAMRVLDAEGRVVRTRTAGGRTIAPGLGPSLRFQVRAPGVYRLEARGRRQVVRPLLRRAAN